jgi:hypothetical protein
MTKLGALASLAGSGAFAMTLMACYGRPISDRDDYSDPRMLPPDGSITIEDDDASTDGDGKGDASADGSLTDAGASDADAGDNDASDAQ